MSGVWVFNNGVIRLVENPHDKEDDNQQQNQGDGSQSAARSSLTSGRRKVLIYLPTGEAVTSYTALVQILTNLGWERYYGGGDPDLIQFHNHSSIDLISLPRNFSRFNSVHMYDIVVKNPNIFHVRDIA